MDIVQVVEFIYTAEPATLSTVMDALADRMDALFDGEDASDLMEGEAKQQPEAPENTAPISF